MAYKIAYRNSFEQDYKKLKTHIRRFILDIADKIQDGTSENETTQRFFLEDKQWHPIELRVTTDSICAFVDAKQFIALVTAGKKTTYAQEAKQQVLQFGPTRQAAKY